MSRIFFLLLFLVVNLVSITGCRGAAETAVSRLDQRELLSHQRGSFASDTIIVERFRETFISPETCYVKDSEKVHEVRILQQHDTTYLYKDSVQVREVEKIVQAQPSRWQRWKSYIINGFLISLIFTMLICLFVGRR